MSEVDALLVTYLARLPHRKSAKAHLAPARRMFCRSCVTGLQRVHGRIALECSVQLTTPRYIVGGLVPFQADGRHSLVAPSRVARSLPGPCGSGGPLLQDVQCEACV